MKELITEKNIEILFHNLDLIKDNFIILCMISKRLDQYDGIEEELEGLALKYKKKTKNKIFIFKKDIIFLGRQHEWVLPKQFYRNKFNLLDIIGLLRNQLSSGRHATHSKQKTIESLIKDFQKRSFSESAKAYSDLPKVFATNLGECYGDIPYVKMTLKLLGQMENKANREAHIKKCANFKPRAV